MDKASTRDATYRIVSRWDGWVIDHDGKVSGPYEMPEAALEAAFAAASLALKQRLNIDVSLRFSEEARNADSPWADTARR